MHAERSTPPGEELRIRLLGDFAVTVGSRQVDPSHWRLRKAKSLVKMLALAPGHRLHREQLTEVLWPELEPEAAFNNFRKALHVARRALEPSGRNVGRYLHLQDEILSLAPDGPLWIDAEAFEQTAAQARRSGNPASYRAAIELYTGDLLPEDRYEDWSSSRREALRQEYLTLLVELAARYEERRDFAAAIEAQQQVLAHDPGREDAHRALMRLDAMTGQRDQALRQYRMLRDAVRRELDTEPDAASRRLYQDILVGRFPPEAAASGETASAHGSPATPTRPRSNLPLPLTSFIGREREMTEVRQMLRKARFLTLTGSGGVGKTRLALEVAAAVVEEFAEGVWLIDLSALSDSAFVPQAVASVLGVQDAGRLLAAAIADYLQFRSTLIILDNCEHLAAPCAQLAESLLRRCPDIRILTTSREPLGLAGEQLYRVPPLPVLDLRTLPPPENMVRNEAVRLFVERASQIEAGFRLTEANARAVAEICHALGGLPLAIELAAARISALEPHQIASRLDDQFRLLTGGARTALPRHQTLQAALDWSFDLLSAQERVLFRRLAVFAGGCALEGAEAICGGDDLGPPQILDLLTRLVNKSLVVTREGGAEVRYRLLEPIRQFGWGKLQAAGESGSVRDRHLDWYVQLTERADEHLRGHKQAEWLRLLEREHENLRAALQWSLETNRPEAGLRLAGALPRFWLMHGRITEGRQWLGRLLSAGGARSVPAAVWARALAEAADLAKDQFDDDRAIALAEESLAVYRELGDERGVAFNLLTIGRVARWHGDYEQAGRLTDEGLALYRHAGDQWGIAGALFALGATARVRKEFATATRHLQESLALYRQIEDRHSMAQALYFLGLTARAQGDFARAARCAEEAAELARGMGDRYSAAHALHLLGTVAWYQGERERAAALHAESLPLFEELGDRSCVATTLSDLGLVAQHQGDLKRAGELHKDSLLRRIDLEDKPGVAQCLERLARVAQTQRLFERSVLLLGAAAALREAIAIPMPPVERTEHERVVGAVRAALGGPSFDAAWDKARAMTLEEVIEFAVSEPQ